MTVFLAGFWFGGVSMAEEVDCGDINAVSQVWTTGKCYITLWDAVTAAQNGDTITLSGDAVINETLDITKNLTINLNGHNITATDVRALWVKSGDLTITGEWKISANGDNLIATSSVIRVGDSAANTNKVKLTVDEGVTVTSTKCFGITIFGNNDTDSDKTTSDIEVVINGEVKVTGTEAGVSGNGTNTLSATKITIGSNAKIVSLNDYAIYHPGKGVLTVNGEVEGKWGIEAKAGTVTINDHAKVTAIAETQSHTANNNGTSTAGYAIAAISNEGYVGDPTVTINGGDIIGKISNLSDNGETLKAIIEISSKLWDIIPLAESGTTLTLSDDVEITKTLNITGDLTIDLNGHNITATNVRALHVKSGEVSIIWTWTISANGNGLDESSSVIRVWDGNTNSNTVKLVIGAGVTVSTDKSYGVTVFWKNAGKIEVEIYGKVKVTGESTAVSGNGNSWLAETKISVKEWAEISSEKSYAIYHPEKWDLIIEGIVEWKWGIEAKAGNVTINDPAKVTATATSQNHKTYNNGPSTEWYAIASVSNSGYTATPVAQINGWTIIGKISTLVDSGSNDVADLDVLWWTFSEEPDSKYIVDWKAACDYVDWSTTPRHIWDKVTVTFNWNGGTVVTWSVNLWEWGKVSKPANPTRANYDFAGWYSDSALTKAYDFNSAVTANITLYAKWTAKSSWGSSSGGGSGGGSSSSSSSSSKTTTDTKKAEETKTENKTSEEINLGWEVTEESTSTTGETTTPDNWYSKEFNDAYTWAFKNGITTMDSIEKADMNAPLTRIAMAKMLSQYAINVLGRTPDTTKVVPAFPDVSAELDAAYNSWVTLAYQLGIMWINIDKFRPFDLVTRAEFGTALSRMLYDTADWEKAYYETHLAKLMEEKIITVDTPDMQELRWYVMIMLMRSANK